MQAKIHAITATGTDLGKTFVAQGLARAWRALGRRVAAVKPVASGFDPAERPASDAGRLLAACGQAVTAEAIAAISPWCFQAATSPDRAAALEGRAIDFAALTAWCVEAAQRSGADHLLIEGAGGVMAPLSAQHTQRDWLAAIQAPVLLVAGSYLGALSHTLTALAALREVGVRPRAILLNPALSAGFGAPVALADTCAALSAHAPGIALLPLSGDFAALARALEQDLPVL